MTSRRTKEPHQRYAHDVAGMPCYAATTSFTAMITPESMADGIPQDDENCSVAKGCRVQLHTPYVSVGRHRTDLAMPHSKGVEKPGFDGLWAVIRFKNSAEARKVIVAADTGVLDIHHGQVLELDPPSKSDLPHTRRKRADNTDRTNHQRAAGGKRRRPDQTLTKAGVRSLTGQRR